MKNNRELRVRVRGKLILFYFELTPTDLWFGMFQTLVERKKYGKEKWDKQPPNLNKKLEKSN